MPKVTKSDRNKRDTVVVKTKDGVNAAKPSQWWNHKTRDERGLGMLSTATYLKENNQWRYRQASMYSRLYGNTPMFGTMGGGIGRMSSMNQLPTDRPTMNVVQSCVDTLVSRITQSRPRPIFLTDNGDYKERNLAKKLNQFMDGELYQTKAYEMGELILRDAAVLGTGCVKIYEKDQKVCLERVLFTEILVDTNDSLYGDPRQLYQVKLIDREVLAEIFPKDRNTVEKAEQGYPDNSADNSKSVSDLVIVVEGWRLPSGKDAGDGRHTIACSSGTLLDEEWDKPSFPFVFLQYNPRLLGFWGQSLAEQLMGTQMEINKLLMTISASINLVGVPRVFVEDGSKVVKAHLNNQVGAIVTYRGTKPEYQVAPCVPQEMYAQLQRLVDYAYQQSGISALAAASEKPKGLDSGAALREYDDLQSDRFAALNKRYDNMFIALAYQIIDLAKDIAEETGSYQTVYPNKDGTKEIDLPAASLLQDPFVIQCFDASSLPRDPAGRLQKVTEMIQAGMIDIKEGRRMLDFPDLQQNERLENASEERIFQALDQMVEEGEYTPPDPFMDLMLAKKLCIQYYNLYVPAKLEDDRAQMLRDFSAQIDALQAEAMSAMQPQQPGMAAPQGNPPQAQPMPLPQSQLVPNMNQ